MDQSFDPDLSAMLRATRRLDRTAAERARKLAATLGAERRGRARCCQRWARRPNLPPMRGNSELPVARPQSRVDDEPAPLHASAGSLFFVRGGRKKALCCARVVDRQARLARIPGAKKRRARQNKTVQALARAGVAHKKVRASQKETHRSEVAVGNEAVVVPRGAPGDTGAVVHRRNLVLPQPFPVRRIHIPMRRNAHAAAARRISGVKGRAFCRPTAKSGQPRAILDTRNPACDRDQPISRDLRRTDASRQPRAAARVPAPRQTGNRDQGRGQDDQRNPPQPPDPRTPAASTVTRRPPPPAPCASAQSMFP